MWYVVDRDRRARIEECITKLAEKYANAPNNTLDEALEGKIEFLKGILENIEGSYYVSTVVPTEESEGEEPDEEEDTNKVE